MKTILISESQIDRLVFQYLNTLFDIAEINWTHPYDYDEESGVEGEDINRIEFYLGNYADGDTCFRWSSCDYFNKNSPAQDSCPEVVIESPYDEQLNNYFGDLWEEPFKKWFKENFQLPVKTVATW